MTIPTISTYALFQTTLDDVSKVENNINTEQEQLSSGNNAQNFGQMAGQTQQYLSMDNTIGKLNEYYNNNQQVLTLVNNSSSALGQIITTGNNLQSLLSQQLTGVAGNDSFTTQLQSMWQELAGQMNSSVDGQYLFSGTAVDTPPVNANNFPTLQTTGVPDLGYYQGNDQDITVNASDSVTLTYNTRADSQGFQNLVAGIATAQQGFDKNSDSLLQQAETLIQQGTQQIISQQATVDANASELTNLNEQTQNSKLYWQGVQQTIGNTDIVSVSTQVSVNQGILQAAFEAFAKVNSLQLSTYLQNTP